VPIIRFVRAERVPVSYDPTTGLLVVGELQAIVERASGGNDNEVVLRTYLDLVATARGVALGPDMPLRGDDIEILAALLDLEDTELEARLMRMLGVDAPTAHRLRGRIKRHRLVLAAASLSIGIVAAAPFVPRDNHPTVATTVTPTAQHAVDIGTALVIERSDAQP
jgi:hypothetical protein